jgi:hypothetical protein
VLKFLRKTEQYTHNSKWCLLRIRSGAGWDCGGSADDLRTLGHMHCLICIVGMGEFI